jgi:hypothetical protein
MRPVVIALAAMACAALASCSQFPSQGFLTKSLGGTIMNVAPSMDPPARSEVYAVPDRVGGEPTQHPDDCTTAARARADDIKAQGFDEDLQKRTYDATFANCSKWAGRH